jgi:predicted PurR-regulated permease PerM
MTESVREPQAPVSPQSDSAYVLLALKILLACAALLGVLWGLYTLRTILLMLLLSLLLSYLLEPVVQAFEQGRMRWGSVLIPLPRLPRLLTIFLVYLFGLTVVILLSLAFLPIALKEGGSLIQNVPAYVTFLQEMTAELAALYDHYNLPTAWQPLVNSSLTRGVQTLLKVFETLVAEFTTALSRSWWLFMPPLLALILLKDSGRLRAGVLLCFSPGQRQRAAYILNAIEEVLAAFIRTQLVLCILMGLWITGLLTFLGIPYGFLLGFLAGVLEFIPVFGPLVAGLLVCLVAVVRDPVLALWVLLALVLLRVLQDYVVVPRVMGQHIHLHPALIIIAVLCGAELAGTAGVFLATPVAAVMRVLLATWQRSRDMVSPSIPSYADDTPPVSEPVSTTQAN